MLSTLFLPHFLTWNLAYPHHPQSCIKFQLMSTLYPSIRLVNWHINRCFHISQIAMEKQKTTTTQWICCYMVRNIDCVVHHHVMAIAPSSGNCVPVNTLAVSCLVKSIQRSSRQIYQGKPTNVQVMPCLCRTK